MGSAPTFDHAVGVQVRRRRTTEGLTQDQLARRLSLARTSVTNIEAGRQPLSAYLLWRLIQVLNCDFEDLLPAPGDVDEETRPLPTDLTPRSRDVINRMAGSGR